MPNLKLVTRIMLPAVLFFASAVGNIVAMGNEKPVFSGEVTDSVSKETLTGANISVITPNDTVWTVSDEKGLFSISVPKADKYWVSAYFVGYTAWKKEYRLPTENIKILLSPSSDKIDEAVLKEEVPVMIEKGYTSGDGSGTDGEGGIATNIRALGAVGISITPASAWGRFSTAWVLGRAWI